jgi:UPF0716 protein FxsA
MGVLIRILVVLITVPLLETVILLWLADHLGFWTTLAMVIGSGVLGTWLLRRQGLRAIARIRDEFSQGRLPATDLLDGMLVVVAGVLLLTPGVITDSLGIALLFSPSRSLLRGWLVRWFKSRWHLQGFTSATGQPGSPRQGSQVIDSYVLRSDEEQRSN